MTPDKNVGLGTKLVSYLWRNNLVYVFTIVCGTASLLCSLFDRGGRGQHRIARLWSWLILRVAAGCHLAVEGLENVDFTRPQVFASNHLSYLDTPVIFLGIPVQFRIMANRELFSVPFMGWHLARSGQIPVERNDPRASLRSLLAASHTVKNGMPILVFPEGGRTHDGHLQPFMGGAFLVAIKAGVSVVPVTIVGTYEAMPRVRWMIAPRTVTLVFGKPVSTEGYSSKQMDDLAAAVRQVIEETYYSRCVVGRPPAQTAVKSHA